MQNAEQNPVFWFVFWCFFFLTALLGQLGREVGGW